MKLKLYIAGPITGTTDFEARFCAAEAEIVALGHVPVNPLLGMSAEWKADPPKYWKPAMQRAIRTLLETDGIYLLANWFDSRGARIEQMIAQGLGLLVLFQQDPSPVAFPLMALDQPHRIMPGIGDFDKFGNKLTTEERNNE